MIKLKSLLEETTSEDYPEDSNLWDNWEEYIDHFDYDLEKGELKKLIQRFSLEYEGYINNQIVKLWDNQKHIVYLTYDTKNETFDLIKDVNDWIYNHAEKSLNVDVNNLYNGYIEGTLKDMKENPGKVYH